MSLFDDTTAPALNPPTSEETAPEQSSTQNAAPEGTAQPATASTPDQKPEQKPQTMSTATEDFASALENFTVETEEASGDDNVIKGTVLKLTATHVVVDIGAKSEGMLPLSEVLDHEGKPRFQPGDAIDVMREKGETEEGYINLSHQKAQRLRAWDEVERAFNEKKPIDAVVIDRIKGGLTVDILGARAFLPGSQVDLRPVRNLDGMKGQTMQVAVIKLNKKRGNIVVSRKQLLEEEQAEKRGKTLEHLDEGAILTGVVKNLTDYGAFVDMGGLDGLLHITDMSWGRLTHPRDLVNVGDQIQVKVLKYDKDKQRVSLGFKQLTPDPWLDAEHRYPGRRTRQRARDQRDRLRRIRGAGTGYRRPGARQRNDLVQADEASVEAGQCWRSGGMRCDQRESYGAADLARYAATGDQSMGSAAREISRWARPLKDVCAT